MPQQSTSIAAFEQGVIEDSFVIQYALTGDWCDSRPVVVDSSADLQSHFAFVAKQLDQPISTGVYELSSPCREAWSDSCSKSTTFQQLSNNPAELAQYEAEWRQKERRALQIASEQELLMPSIIVAVVLFAILWPWILIKIWPKIGSKLPLFLGLAILPQYFLADILPPLFFWSDQVLQVIADYASVVLLVVIAGEIILLIGAIARIFWKK
ncbi:MAG: hypothetical protein WDZ94_03370 [Patescibacteria group bacterium]